MDTHFWGPGGLWGPWIHDVRGFERGMGVILDVPLGLNGLAMQQVGEGGGSGGLWGSWTPTFGVLGVFGALKYTMLGGSRGAWRLVWMCHWA